jgi:hypothetical protein
MPFKNARDSLFSSIFTYTIKNLKPYILNVNISLSLTNFPDKILNNNVIISGKNG